MVLGIYRFPVLIFILMQYLPFSQAISGERRGTDQTAPGRKLLEDFPGCHSLLSLKCQRRPRALTALLKPPRCCQNVLEEPEELSTTRYQANGLCTGQLHFFGQGEQAARRAELVAAARAAGELRGLCPVLQQGPRTVPKRRTHVGRTAGSDTEAQHRGLQRISRVRALAHVFQRPWPQKSAWFIPDFLHEKNLSDLSHWNEPRMQMSEPEEPREVEKPREKESVMDAISKQTHLIEGSKPVSFLRDPYKQRSLKNKEFRRSSHDLLTKVYLAREVSAALHNLIKCNTGTNTSPKLRADSSAQGQTVLDGKQIPVG
ncbi:uncharacterized protein [Anser cygnoides]|uniref:uncharacterized protein isoform X1 n=1 Tax=Anser cygnoides TaxID=8845 RepID=UPI0034D20D2F